MKVKEFPRLFEQYTEQCLPNGLRIRVFYKPEFDKVYAFLAVHCGSVDLSYALGEKTGRFPAGTAHYLEHKMFDLPDGNVMQMFTALGGRPNAFTGYGMTAYYVQTNLNAEENLRLLLRMVMTPYFTEESVEKERGIIAQEIKMYEDSPDTKLYEQLFANLFPAHPIRVPIAGSTESTRQISVQTLREFYDAFYQPSNMILCVAGKMAPERVFAIAEEQTPPQSRQVGVTIPEIEAIPAASEIVCEMDVSMPMFTIGFRCPDTQKGDAVTEIAADIAAEMTVGEASELYQSLYNDRLIDSGFSIGFESIRGKSLISASGDSKDPDAVCAAIIAQAKKLRMEGIPSDEFQRLKKSAIGRKIRNLDSFGNICYRESAEYFEGIEYLRFPEAYSSVTEHDVLKQLDHITAEGAVKVVILPRETQEEVPCS